jgi:hypothetical protein
MIMGLIGRKKATPATAANIHDDDEDEAIFTPAPVDYNFPAEGSKKKEAANAVTDPAKGAVRKAKGMRDSDIIDEHGRSAEQLAAESAAEFDIVGLAKRVADMPQQSVAQAEADVADISTTDFVAPAGLEITSRDAPIDRPQPQNPEMMAAPELEAAPAAPSFFEGGHASIARHQTGSRRASRAARQAYWSKIGQLEEAKLPSSNALPETPWPSGAAGFRVIRTAQSLIIASDGLSDPFGPFSEMPDQNGYGLEVFIEVEGWQALPFDAVRKTWGFQAIEALAELCVRAGGLEPALRQYGLLSLALPLARGPKDWLEDDPDARLGGLINMPLPPGRATIEDMPLSEVKLVALTLISSAELDECVIDGGQARRALADDLMTTGTAHRTVTTRALLR